jgi:beta-glucosidase
MGRIAVGVALGALALAACGEPAERSAVEQPELGARHVEMIEDGGLRFKDLNRNGALDPYEDWRLDAAMRAADLVGRMTLAEKAGAMMHGTLPGAEDAYGLEQLEPLIVERGINSFITRMAAEPRIFAEQNNAIQEIAERARLGVPLTISTDPRNHFAETFGASVQASGFSQWPEVLGLAAIDDAAVVRQFGDIARREYRAVGIHMALSPQADLATEPRWPRIDGTFGDNPERVSRMVAAYVEGFQGGAEGVTGTGIITVVKHWVGYGAAANEGFDSHSYYGRHASLTNETLELHLAPFEAAFASGVGGIMPTYSIIQGVTVGDEPLEPVGAGFNAQILTRLLRQDQGFEGLALSDWAITNDCTEACMNGSPEGEPFVVAMPWGVESLTQTERFARGVQAGLDQFGGTMESQHLIAAVESGLISESRLDESVARIVALKMRQGLFENPYVDPAAAEALVGNAEFQSAAMEAQRRSVVLLSNDGVLPLAPGTSVYLDGLDPEAASAAGLTVASSPEDADVAVVRAAAPYETLHPRHMFGSFQHEGNLAFAPGQGDFDRIVSLAQVAPTVVAVHLDRPAVLTQLAPHAGALLGVFGASDAALLDVLTGKSAPQGSLPFELPSSMEAVAAQRPDLPSDSEAPLFAYGHSGAY